MLQYRSQASSNSMEIARMRFAQTDDIMFEYSKNETNDTVFPGKILCG